MTVSGVLLVVTAVILTACGSADRAVPGDGRSPEARPAQPSSSAASRPRWTLTVDVEGDGKFDVSSSDGSILERQPTGSLRLERFSVDLGTAVHLDPRREGYSSFFGKFWIARSDVSYTCTDRRTGQVLAIGAMWSLEAPIRCTVGPVTAPGAYTIVGAFQPIATPPGPRAEVTLGRVDNGRTIDVPVGGTLEISLAGGGAVPYRWELDRTPGPVLEQVGAVEEKRPTTDLPGAPATMIFRLRARAPGEERLALSYRQVFGDRSVAEMFAITVRSR
jgi:predicted secreted protein